MTEELPINKIGKSTNTVPEPFSFDWYRNLFLENKYLTFQIIAISSLIQVFALGLPIFYMVIFDRVFGRQNLDTLNIMAIGMAIILLSDLVFKMLQAYTLSA